MPKSARNEKHPMPPALREESPPAVSSQGGPVHQLITQRAHRKWKERGCRTNTAIQDWLEAEAEVKDEIRRGLRY